MLGFNYNGEFNSHKCVECRYFRIIYYKAFNCFFKRCGFTITSSRVYNVTDYSNCSEFIEI